MTIKTSAADTDDHPERDLEEGEIIVDASPAERVMMTTDGSIPMVEAIPVNDVTTTSSSSTTQVPPPYNPSYYGTTSYNSSNDQQRNQQQYQQHQDEEVAMRIQQQQQQSALQPQPSPQLQQPVYSNVQPLPSQVQTSPPGLPPNGRWVHLTTVGPTTWTVCTVISVLFCLFMCFPCGVWAFLCPCDEERVYLLDGRLFNDRGQMIGSARSRRYRG